MTTDLLRYESGIRRTGFDLEYRVATALRAAGWSIIANKYYVDDHQDVVREIDMVAYKAAALKHFHVFTTIIVSCKKSEKNVWAFLSKDRPLDDPNAELQPTHIWTNCKAHAVALGEGQWARKYYEGLKSRGLTWLVAPPDVDIFAFQEMNRESGAPQNDRPLFESVTSLMKAQAYELASLPARRKAPATYQFNLLTVADTEFVRLHFDGAGVTASHRDWEHYVARYIVNKQQTTARVHFCTDAALSETVAEYERLHAANREIFEELDTAFYTDLLGDPFKADLVEPDFNVDVVDAINRALAKQPGGNVIDVKQVSAWRADEAVFISVDPRRDVDILNGDESLRSTVLAALRKHYRYDGPFQFTPW